MTFILSIFEVHLEVIGTKVGGERVIVIARSFLFMSGSLGVTFFLSIFHLQWEGLPSSILVFIGGGNWSTKVKVGGSQCTC